MIKKVYVCEICERVEDWWTVGWIKAKITLNEWNWGIFRKETHICPKCVKVIKKLSKRVK